MKSAHSSSDPIMLASTIDHTLLAPEATATEISQLCHDAVEHQFHSVCVQPSRVPLAVEILAGSAVTVCTVVGFPHGATSTAAKVAETRAAIGDGAAEIDMVLNIGWLKDGDERRVQEDIRAVVQAAGAKALVKVILETAKLTDEEIRQACESACQAGAHFVKTSTGYGGGGATLEAVRLMKRTVDERCRIKASGGIRDRATALAMLEAGADRLGTSRSVAIVKEPA